MYETYCILCFLKRSLSVNERNLEMFGKKKIDIKILVRKTRRKRKGKKNQYI
jgi:hypothetical protein